MPGLFGQHHQLDALRKDHPALLVAFYMFVFELSYLLIFSLFCEEMREKAYPAEIELNENPVRVDVILMFSYS